MEQSMPAYVCQFCKARLTLDDLFGQDSDNKEGTELVINFHGDSLEVNMSDLTFPTDSIGIPPDHDLFVEDPELDALQENMASLVTSSDGPICVRCYTRAYAVLEKAIVRAVRQNEVIREETAIAKATQANSDPAPSTPPHDLAEARERVKRAVAEADSLSAQLLPVAAREAKVWSDLSTAAMRKDEQTHTDMARTLLTTHSEAFTAMLRDSDILTDMFPFSHVGDVPTINGLRLGRTDTVPTPWDEVNAALGDFALLLHCLATRLRLRPRPLKLIPLVSSPMVEGPNEKGRVERCELYIEPTVRKRARRNRFNRALAGVCAYVCACEHALDDYGCYDDHRLHFKVGIPEPFFPLPIREWRTKCDQQRLDPVCIPISAKQVSVDRADFVLADFGPVAMTTWTHCIDKLCYLVHYIVKTTKPK
eukprot:gnl/Dysnectes_brevis/3775_a4854_1263.p1 GENE.gnl/Dysnectes_brevis/3775_a4854_1263~~gnl/Dysnectes_brevis/3775_a4854_1263.p1  ORF type:complete len:422 (-),score=95.57 gnl/Dysnectes_brevis/3775_a4854_1263:64-1329(-)